MWQYVAGGAFKKWLGQECTALLNGLIYSWINRLMGYLTLVALWEKGERPDLACSAPSPCDTLHHLTTLWRVPTSKKALTRCTPSTLDFSAALTVKNKFLFFGNSENKIKSPRNMHTSHSVNGLWALCSLFSIQPPEWVCETWISSCHSLAQNLPVASHCKQNEIQTLTMAHRAFSHFLQLSLWPGWLPTTWAYLAFLKHAKHGPTSGPLHLQRLLPKHSSSRYLQC